jgi:threonine dehydrogenase-like Zn-dependent dehydrogenase
LRERTRSSAPDGVERVWREACGDMPKLIDLVLSRTIDPGKVFDLTLPLNQVAEGYQAMDECRAIKALLRP